jgi:RNA polymerase sigma factor (sigma-70 family)
VTITSAASLAAEPPVDHAKAPVVLPIPATDDFAELFRYHYPRLVRALQLAGAAHSQAEDTAQEAFARTFAHWRRVRTGSNPAGYLFRVAFRLLRRRGLLPPSPLDDQLESGPIEYSTEDTATARVDIERALAVMPPRRRACVVLCWLLEATTADAADALNLAPGTVRKQLELARRQLAGQLTG